MSTKDNATAGTVARNKYRQGYFSTFPPHLAFALALNAIGILALVLLVWLGGPL